MLVSYDIDFTNIKDRFLSLNRSCLGVYTNICFDGGAPFEIAYPSQSSEYIPVRMVDGYGEVLLTAQYGEGLQLNIISYKYAGALPPFYLN